MKGLLRWTARHRGWVIGGVWFALFGSFVLASYLRGNNPVEQVVAILQGMQNSPFAGLWLLLIYVVRPLTFIPVTVLTVFAGFLFGPVYGTVLSALAATGTAMLAYLLARAMTGRRQGVPGNMERRLRENAFESVLTFRLMSVPGDLLNYFAGALRINFWAFSLATFLGGFPGVVMGVLAGASITGVFTFEGVSIRWEFLVASALLLVAGLATARWLRRRERSRGTDDT